MLRHFLVFSYKPGSCTRTRFQSVRRFCRFRQRLLCPTLPCRPLGGGWQSVLLALSRAGAPSHTMCLFLLAAVVLFCGGCPGVLFSNILEWLRCQRSYPGVNGRILDYLCIYLCIYSSIYRSKMVPAVQQNHESSPYRHMPCVLQLQTCLVQVIYFLCSSSASPLRCAYWSETPPFLPPPKKNK